MQYNNTGLEQMGYNLLQNTPTLIPLYANMYIAVQMIATAKTEMSNSTPSLTAVAGSYMQEQS